MIADRREMEADLGTQTFRWREKFIPCVPSSLQAGTIIQLGGYQGEIRLQLIVRWDNFVTIDSELITIDSEEVTIDDETPQPVSGNRYLEFDGVEYRVLTVRKLPAKDAVELTLVDVDK